MEGTRKIRKIRLNLLLGFSAERSLGLLKSWELLLIKIKPQAASCQMLVLAASNGTV